MDQLLEDALVGALTLAVALGIAWLLWIPGKKLTPKPVKTVQVVILSNESKSLSLASTRFASEHLTFLVRVFFVHRGWNR